MGDLAANGAPERPRGAPPLPAGCAGPAGRWVEARTADGRRARTEALPGATVAGLRQALRLAFAGSGHSLQGPGKLDLYLRGRKLEDSCSLEVLGSEREVVLSAVLKRRGKKRCAPVPLRYQEASLEAPSPFLHVPVPAPRRGSGSCALSQPSEEGRPPLPLGLELEQLCQVFRAMAAVVGFLNLQEIIVTTSALRRSLPGFEDGDLEKIATLCPGLVRLHRVASISEEVVGELVPAANLPSAVRKSETVIELKLPRSGASARDNIAEPYQNKRKKLRIVSGSVGYGDEVYSAIAEVMPTVTPNPREEVDLLPALVQGCRAGTGMSSQRNIYKRSLSSMVSMTSRWLRCFREGLVEAVKIEHDAFLRSRGLEWDLAAERSWHPDFDVRAIKANDVVFLAKRTQSSRPDFQCVRSEKVEKGRKFSPCRSVKKMKPAEFLEHLKEDIGLGGRYRAGGGKDSTIIVHERNIPARHAEYCSAGEMKSLLREEIKKCLASVGIHKMYSHQAEALRHLRCGSNVCVCTSTASGKSICYNVPTLNILLSSEEGTALFIMPTKALAQDQLRATQQLLRGLPEGAPDFACRLGVFDGDTSREERERLRDNGRVLITNPDILHVTALPKWKHFRNFFRGLQLVVVDEAHSYTGVFGCHVSLVLRRLRRLCEREFAVKPQFVMSSATISNGEEHSACLTGISREHWAVVRKDGSPRGEKTFVLWNPPVRQNSMLRRNTHSDARAGGREMVPHGGRRRTVAADTLHQRTSPIMEMSFLLAEAVQHGLRTLAFCKTRKMVELVLQYTREILSDVDPELGDFLASYRAGYSPVERRGIEGSLFSGQLLGVCATNALELGIDVGALDVTLHLGFPGRLCSLWQQAGRAGRRSQHALSVMVGFDGPLDQYLFNHPENLFDAKPEYTAVDPNNPQVLEQHLPCAAHELPLVMKKHPDSSDEDFFGEDMQRSADVATLSGALGRNPVHPSSPILEYIGGAPGGPAKHVSLRAINDETFKVMEGGRLVEEIESSKVFYQIYEGAIYMNQGTKYLCTKLDLEKREATVKKTSVGYFTSLIHFKDVEVMGGNPVYPVRNDAGSRNSGAAQIAAAQFVMRVERFDKISLRTRQVFDKCPLRLPDTRYDTIATWVRVPAERLKMKVHLAGREFRAGLHAAGHALLNALPIHIICDPLDVGCLCYSDIEKRYRPSRLLLYDQQPGGTGISQQVQPIWPLLLRSALHLVRTCPCQESTGCPKCTQHPACPQHNQALDKAAAAMVLEEVLSMQR